MQKQPLQWTVIKLINWTSQYLHEKGFDNARLEAERLLAHTLKKRRIDLYLLFDRPLTPSELSLFKTFLKRRLALEPIQYITQETEFFSLPFYVDGRVLIPRPETEILVQLAFEHISTTCRNVSPVRILDVGTGCGNIAIALAKNIKAATLAAVDVSNAALAVARQNAENHGVSERIDFVNWDVFDPPPGEFQHAFHVLISNPPYLSKREYDAASRDVHAEPVIALVAEKEGLLFYKRFSNIAYNLLQPNGYLFLEIDENRAEQTRMLFSRKEYGGVDIKKDLADKDRVLIASSNR